jgi:hypothetical protein
MSTNVQLITVVKAQSLDWLAVHKNAIRAAHIFNFDSIGL